MALQLRLASSSWAPSGGLVIFRATHAWPPTPALEPQEVLGPWSQGAFWIQPASGSGGDAKAAAFQVAEGRHPCAGGGQAPPGHPRKNFSLTNSKCGEQKWSSSWAMPRPPARDQASPTAASGCEVRRSLCGRHSSDSRMRLLPVTQAPFLALLLVPPAECSVCC